MGAHIGLTSHWVEDSSIGTHIGPTLHFDRRCGLMLGSQFNQQPSLSGKLPACIYKLSVGCDIDTLLDVVERGSWLI